ncbi:MAG: ATP phosphoribosyltransferase [Planctomycetota bacterium]
MKNTPRLRLLVPTGRMNEKLLVLLAESGYGIEGAGRDYRPRCADASIEVKMLKPINIPKLVELGRHDLGFCGLDWVREHQTDVEVVAELGLDPVSLVVAAPEGTTLASLKRRKNLVLATEYENLARGWLRRNRVRATLLRTNGTTEVYPPDDADLILDNSASGSTLKANKLDVLGTLMRSSTCLVANKTSLRQRAVAEKIRQMADLLGSTLAARRKVMLEMNVSEKNLERLVAQVPAMKGPTVQALAGSGYAVKTVVDRELVRELLPKLKKLGATDILEMPLRKVLP